MSANGSTTAWRILRARVIREEPTCWLQLPNCTQLSDTADHIIPLSIRPDLRYVRSNLHGACRSCNVRRSNNPPPNRTPPPALDFFHPGTTGQQTL